jgi:aspartate/methionine/tyrosine aminotransferase
VGYVAAAPELMAVLAKAHQFLTFTTPPNLQAAVAHGLSFSDDYFRRLGTEMAEKRDRFAGGLTSLGLEVTPCEGTYFCNIDIRSFRPKGRNAPFTEDRAFCAYLIEEVGVAAIPVSAFYHERPLETVARFCFAKQDTVLDSALEKLSTALCG